MELSVIICTHNPRRDYLERTLNALKAQTLPKEQWELLLIDNASKEPLAGQWDLSWHPHARHIREDELGLTPARLRGIKEAQSELLLFVDDDNLLARDYLSHALELAQAWPALGAWSGKMTPEYEEVPAAELTPLLNCLALNSHVLTRDQWSNAPTLQNHALPCGAGMCVRREVARSYAQLVQGNSLRRALDRKGGSLLSSGDTDMALVGCDLGFGTGIFTRLGLTHLISKKRVQPEYLFRLHEAIGVSLKILAAIRGQPVSRPCLSERLFQKYKYWRAKGADKVSLAAEARIHQRSLELWQSINQPTNSADTIKLWTSGSG